MKVLVVLGTRPEAIKLCPLILHLRKLPAQFEVEVCATGQHREMLDAVLTTFAVAPHYDLNVMEPNQSLASVSARILDGMHRVLETARPDYVVVQGDTTTSFAAALAAFYHRIPVAHVEAGLRTGNLDAPFPEEINRVLTTRLSSLHFAPTAEAAANLAREGVPVERILITGNTGIDALLYTRLKLENGEWTGYTGPLPPPDKMLLLVTTHRRENLGSGLDNICEALLRVVEREDVEVVLPVHPNPGVRQTIRRRLARSSRIHLVPPLDYVPFVDLMRRATLILTDSGGIQEEAPSLGKPVLVLRDVTERQEAISAGTAQLVGTGIEKILSAVSETIATNGRPQRNTTNPFGDGHACERIADRLCAVFSESTERGSSLAVA